MQKKEWFRLIDFEDVVLIGDRGPSATELVFDKKGEGVSGWGLHMPQRRQESFLFNHIK